MAISVLQSESVVKGHIRSTRGPLSSARSETAMMSYQYAPRQHNDGEDDMNMGYMSNFAPQTASVEVRPPQHALPASYLPAPIHTLPPKVSSQGRRSSIKSVKLNRSVSTPNMRPQGTNDGSGNMRGEKRRNKLGYHRSSVACSKFIPPLDPKTVSW